MSQTWTLAVAYRGILASIAPMKPSFWIRSSIKIKLTLIVTAVLLGSAGLVSWSAHKILAHGFQELLNEQEFAFASFVAAELDNDFAVRLLTLEKAAASLGVQRLNGANVQKFLESNANIETQFNGGCYVVDLRGTAIAAIPTSIRRIGVNFIDRDYIASTLSKNRSTISSPIVGKVLKGPLISMATPIHNSSGRVVGAIMGVTDLSSFNFIDRMLESYSKKSGSILIIDPKDNVYISDSDKKYVLKTLPTPGVNPLHDRYMHGYDGFGVVRSPDGEELSAAKHMPTSGWYVETRFSAKAAFVPLRNLYWDLIWILFAVVLGGGLFLWVAIRWQLNPISCATKALSSSSLAGEDVVPLAEGGDDEVGILIASFNRLLFKIRSYQEKLKAVNRALRFRTSVSEVLREAKTELELLQRVCDVGIYKAGYLMSWVGFAMQDQRKSVKPICFSGKEEGYLANANISWEDNEWGRGPTGTSIRERRAVFSRDFLSDLELQPWRKAGVERGYRSSISLPLIIEDKVIGAFTLYDGKPNAFHEEEVRLLLEVVEDLAYGISSVRTKNENIVVSGDLSRKIAELEASRAFSNTLIDALPFPMAILDSKENVLFANGKMQELLKMDPKGAHLEKGVIGERAFEVSRKAIQYKGKDAIIKIFYDMTDRKSPFSLL